MPVVILDPVHVRDDVALAVSVYAAVKPWVHPIWDGDDAKIVGAIVSTDKPFEITTPFKNVSVTVDVSAVIFLRYLMSACVCVRPPLDDVVVVV